MEYIKENREYVRERFRNIYGREPRLFRAPGRVNFIGDHTDYNDGFVLPFAIDRETLVAAAPRSDLRIMVHALNLDEFATIDLEKRQPAESKRWVKYIAGTAKSLGKRFDLQRGADIAFASNVPIGAGLSSSAALEISIGYALLSLNEQEIDKQELAFAAQEAEHKFVGIRTGIMDQFASVYGREGYGLLLDCRSLEIREVPLEIENTVIVVCDTKVKHTLASSEYNTRRAECEQGVALLRNTLPAVRSLRDIDTVDFNNLGELLPVNIRKRCKHVLSENLRTLGAANALVEFDLSLAGRLMFESHRSLRDDYEVSCPELDLLVEAASEIDGIYGARMTGGGFGGCTVNLIEKEAFVDFEKQMNAQYLDKFGLLPEIYPVHAGAGASEII